MRPILILYQRLSGHNVRGISTMIVRTGSILLVQWPQQQGNYSQSDGVPEI